MSVPHREGANYLVTLASGDDVKQLLQAIPSECRPEGPAKRNALLTEVDVDALASSKDEGDLPADAVVKRSTATSDRLAFLRRRRVARALVAEERAEAIKRVRDHVAPGPKPRTELPTRLALSASELERVRPPSLDPPVRDSA